MSDRDQGSGWEPPAPAAPELPPPPPPLAPGAPLGGGARRRRRLAVLLGALVVAVAAGAVVVVVATRGGGSSSGPCPGADGRSRELRRCLAGSLAYVETPLSAGSGVLIADGYVVTNAHVVDPYASVDITFDGGEAFEDVAVVGVDGFADIAVVGPIDVDQRPLELAPIPDFDEAEEPDVFLVGYPGGIESDDPEIALAGGLLSRLRDDAPFWFTYLQTDAAIAGGQSGGALVDEDGTVLGISGLGFAEEFALALSADDVAASIERILAGQGDERRVMPSLGDADSVDTTAELTVSDPNRTIVIPADADRRDIELTVSSGDDVAVNVTTVWGEPIGVNRPGMDLARQLAREYGDSTLDDVDLLDEPEPGHLRFEARGEEDIVVFVTRVDEDASVELSADVPFEVFDDTTDGASVTVGTPLRGIADGFSYDVIHAIELQAGDEVEITVRRGTSDAYFTLLAPGEPYDQSAEPDVDDGGGGLYDLDPHDRFEIDETGVYRIVVGTWEGIVAGYELDVRIAS